MAKPRIPENYYTDKYHLFGAMEKVVESLGGTPESVKETIRLHLLQLLHLQWQEDTIYTPQHNLR